MHDHKSNKSSENDAAKSVKIHTEDEALPEHAPASFATPLNPLSPPRRSNPQQILNLQRLIGNQNVIRLMKKQAGDVQRQPAPAGQPVRDATPAQRREFVQDTISFFNGSAEHYALMQTPLTQAQFERVINNWFSMVTDRERMIQNDPNPDAGLTADLHAAYTRAIRALMTKAARDFGRNVTDLYRENNGRIPMWAWDIPSHLERGISTPIPDGSNADPRTGIVTMVINGIQVRVVPDNRIRGGRGAKTNFSFRTQRIRWRTERQGRQRIVTSFTPNPLPQPTVTIRTTYRRGANAGVASAYGRGTTDADRAGAQVDPRSGTLGFHEGNHGLDYLAFLRANQPPQFTGAVGMTVQEFNQAWTQFRTDWRDYSRQADAESEAHTDQVGNPTLDQYNLAPPQHH